MYLLFYGCVLVFLNVTSGFFWNLFLDTCIYVILSFFKESWALDCLCRSMDRPRDRGGPRCSTFFEFFFSFFVCNFGGSFLYRFVDFLDFFFRNLGRTVVLQKFLSSCTALLCPGLFVTRYLSSPYFPSSCLLFLHSFQNFSVVVFSVELFLIMFFSTTSSDCSHWATSLLSFLCNSFLLRLLQQQIHITLIQH